MGILDESPKAGNFEVCYVLKGQVHTLKRTDAESDIQSNSVVGISSKRHVATREIEELKSKGYEKEKEEIQKLLFEERPGVSVELIINERSESIKLFEVVAVLLGDPIGNIQNIKH